MQVDLHRQPLQLGVLPNGVNVADGQSDKEIHQQNWHQDDEDDEKEERGEELPAFNLRRRRARSTSSPGLTRLVVHHASGTAKEYRLEEGVDEVHLAEHHRPDANHRQNRPTEALARAEQVKLGEENVEAEAEGDDQHREEEDDLDEGGENLEEHHHVDAAAVEALQIEEQVEPGDEDRNGRADVQVAVVNVEEEKGEGHDAAGEVEQPLEDVDELVEVAQALVEEAGRLKAR